MLILSHDFYILIPNPTYFPSQSGASSFPAVLLHFLSCPSAIYTGPDALEKEITVLSRMLATESVAGEHHLRSLVV